MIETPQPLAPELWATLPAPKPESLLEQLATLRLVNAALRAENAVLQARICELEAGLSQNSSNSSRPHPLTCPRPCGNAQLISHRVASEAGSQDTLRPSAGCCRSRRWMR